MADQTRCSQDPAASPQSNQPIESVSAQAVPYEYQPLDPAVDCIRLVNLMPTGKGNDPIVCQMQHVTFAQRPRYEALSYRWGDDTDKKNISINNQSFLVGWNLYQALLRIRDSNEKTMWIDAICINQEDVAEKTRQLRIMPYIYQRAQAVLISLPTYNRYTRISEFMAGSSRLHSPDFARMVLNQVCVDEYWRRVWIVQEISLARNVFIYCGRDMVTWAEFIAALKSDEIRLERSIPVKLQRQIEERHTNGYKLQTLLENHKDALCKEPRDKVFGFVGLAIDCVGGYPLDYTKSLFQVWKDAVLFRNADQECQQRDIMLFGNLVQKLLGGSKVVTTEELDQDVRSRYFDAALCDFGDVSTVPSTHRMVLSSDTRTKKTMYNVLLIPSRLAGQIVSLGPTSKEIISDFAKTASWRSSIDSHLPAAQRPSAREESENFLRTLEEVEEEDLCIVDSSYLSSWNISWKSDRMPGSMAFAESNRNIINVQTLGRALNQDDKKEQPLSDDNDEEESRGAQTTDPSLFLLGGTNSPFNSNGTMGLAPPDAQIGDFVCQVQGMAKAIVVRKENRTLRIIGTAALVENNHKARTRNDGAERTKAKFDTADFGDLPTEERVDLFMDVALAYLLLD